jgi:hypothetical protein
MQLFFPSHLSMLSLKSESPSFQPLPPNMRNSVTQLLIKACFSVSLLASVQAANAVTITYTANSATNVPVGANPRPLQLSPLGTAMDVPARNFIYTGLVGDYAPAGSWQEDSITPVPAGQQRFDYNFPNATSSSTGGTSGSATVHDWTNNLNLTFNRFYLTGPCSYCGLSNAVSQISRSLTGEARYINESPTSSPGNLIPGNQNTLKSSIYDIIFGASGITGTLQYTAFTNVTSNPFAQQSGGTIILNVNDPNPPTTAVPGPLPVLGAGAAFGYSRRLRRRIFN